MTESEQGGPMTLPQRHCPRCALTYPFSPFSFPVSPPPELKYRSSPFHRASINLFPKCSLSLVSSHDISSPVKAHLPTPVRILSCSVLLSPKPAQTLDPQSPPPNPRHWTPSRSPLDAAVARNAIAYCVDCQLSLHQSQPRLRLACHKQG